MKESSSLEFVCGCWYYKVSKEIFFEIDLNRVRKLFFFLEFCEIYIFLGWVRNVFICIIFIFILIGK